MEGATGKKLSAPRKRWAGLSSSFQKLRPWVLGEKEGEGWPGTKGRREAGHTIEGSQGQAGAGSRRAERREGKETKIGLPA